MPITRQPAGSSIGGQFAPGDYWRKEAGQIAFQEEVSRIVSSEVMLAKAGLHRREAAICHLASLGEDVEVSWNPIRGRWQPVGPHSAETAAAVADLDEEDITDIGDVQQFIEPEYGGIDDQMPDLVACHRLQTVRLQHRALCPNWLVAAEQDTLLDVEIDEFTPTRHPHPWEREPGTVVGYDPTTSVVTADELKENPPGVWSTAGAVFLANPGRIPEDVAKKAAAASGGGMLRRDVLDAELPGWDKV